MNRFLSIIFLLALLSLSVFLCFYNLGTGAEWGSYTAVDEGRHIRVAQEMRIFGNYFTPTLDGVPYFLKPPFKILLTLIPTRLLGESTFSFRLLDGLLGLGLISLCFLSGQIFFGSYLSGMWAVFFLLGNYIFFFSHGVRSATQDTMMLFLTTAALLLSWKLLSKLSLEDHDQVSKRSRLRLATIFGALIGFAVLTKSAAGLYPLPIVALWILLDGKLLLTIKKCWGEIVVVLVVSIIIAGSYFVPHLLYDASAYDQAIKHEIVGRFSKGVHNPGRPSFYLESIIRGRVVPALPLLLATIWFLYCGFIVKSRSHRYLVAWAGLPFICYSLLNSRLEWYVAPCYIPFALIIGQTTTQAIDILREKLLEVWHSRNFIARNLVVSLATFVFLSFSLISGISHIVKVASRVYQGEEILPIDSLTQVILKDLKLHQTKDLQIVSHQIPELAKSELVYWNMLRPSVVAVDDEQQLVALLQEPSSRVVFTSLEQGHKLLHQRRPDYYYFLPRCTVEQEYGFPKRTSPILVLLYLSPSELEIRKQAIAASHHFLPVERTISFKNLNFQELHFGWYHDRWKKDSGIVNGPEGSLLLAPDQVIAHYGAEILINLARFPDFEKRVSVKFFLNANEIGQIDNLGKSLTTISLPIAPNIFYSNKENFLGIRITTADGSSIPRNVHSIIVRWIETKLIPQTPPTTKSTDHLSE